MWPYLTTKGSSFELKKIRSLHACLFSFKFQPQCWQIFLKQCISFSYWNPTSLMAILLFKRSQYKFSRIMIRNIWHLTHLKEWFLLPFDIFRLLFLQTCIYLLKKRSCKYFDNTVWMIHQKKILKLNTKFYTFIFIIYPLCPLRRGRVR